MLFEEFHSNGCTFWENQLFKTEATFIGQGQRMTYIYADYICMYLHSWDAERLLHFEHSTLN